MMGVWEAFQGLPCFVVNMDRCRERWEVSERRIRGAGFRNVQRFRGTDAVEDDLPAAWAEHGSPKFDPSDEEFVTYPGKQGCMLSHLNLWKHLIDTNTPRAIVFEDDVQFHKDWDSIAPRYLATTPEEYDILYMGSQLDYWIDAHIIQTPVFCTHAYVITLEGARRLYDLLVREPRGVRTIDCMLIDHMKQRIFRMVPCPFVWYVWNGLKFPDPKAISDPDWAKRNTGLVFQDASLGTYVRPW
jgi:GR25 family glycosyltransferase involved in LPS biosynthesis